MVCLSVCKAGNLFIVIFSALIFFRKTAPDATASQQQAGPEGLAYTSFLRREYLPTFWPSSRIMRRSGFFGGMDFYDRSFAFQGPAANDHGERMGGFRIIGGIAAGMPGNL
jgi:hypothetical protein